MTAVILILMYKQPWAKINVLEIHGSLIIVILEIDFYVAMRYTQRMALAL